MNVVCRGQVDIPTFVTGKVLNTAMRHLHTCLLAVREASSQQQRSGEHNQLPVVDVAQQLGITSFSDHSLVQPTLPPF